MHLMIQYFLGIMRALIDDAQVELIVLAESKARLLILGETY